MNRNLDIVQRIVDSPRTIPMLLILYILVSLTACSDATRASIGALGSSADVTCYSGGQVIYKGKSTGRVKATHESDGWEFEEQGTGKFVRVSGDCVVSN